MADHIDASVSAACDAATASSSPEWLGSFLPGRRSSLTKRLTSFIINVHPGFATASASRYYPSAITRCSAKSSIIRAVHVTAGDAHLVVIAGSWSPVPACHPRSGARAKRGRFRQCKRKRGGRYRGQRRGAGTVRSGLQHGRRVGRSPSIEAPHCMPKMLFRKIIVHVVCSLQLPHARLHSIRLDVVHPTSGLAMHRAFRAHIALLLLRSRRNRSWRYQRRVP